MPNIHRSYTLKLDYDTHRQVWAANLMRRTEAGGYARVAFIVGDNERASDVGAVLAGLGEQLVEHQAAQGELP